MSAYQMSHIPAKAFCLRISICVWSSRIFFSLKSIDRIPACVSFSCLYAINVWFRWIHIFFLFIVSSLGFHIELGHVCFFESSVKWSLHFRRIGIFFSFSACEWQMLRWERKTTHVFLFRTYAYAFTWDFGWSSIA